MQAQVHFLPIHGSHPATRQPRTFLTRIAPAFAALVLFAAATPALAWNAPGHQLVGAIAGRLIAGTRAQREVRALLGFDLAAAAVWADCVKGVSEKDGRFHYKADARYPECRPFEGDAERARMEAFVRNNLDACHPQAWQESCHRQYHYADVALQRDAYRRGLTGTSDHDVVAAIGAALSVLQGGKAPAPFRIADKREALLLLAHYAGDIHQPLHVGAVYLDTTGKVIDPDADGYDPAEGTQGGNRLEDGTTLLHREWDTLPPALIATDTLPQLAAEARTVPLTPGPVKDWGAAWAGDSLRVEHTAFAGIRYSREYPGHNAQPLWRVTTPEGYTEHRAALQRAQVVKAGARLAQLLRALWP